VIGGLDGVNLCLHLVTFLLFYLYFLMSILKSVGEYISQINGFFRALAIDFIEGDGRGHGGIQAGGLTAQGNGDELVATALGQ
jgi:hypothetical protein